MQYKKLMECAATSEVDKASWERDRRPWRVVQLDFSREIPRNFILYADEETGRFALQSADGTEVKYDTGPESIRLVYGK